MQLSRQLSIWLVEINNSKPRGPSLFGGRRQGSFPEQWLVIEPRLDLAISWPFISLFYSLLQEFHYIHHYFIDWLCCGYSFSVQLMCKSLELPCNYEKSSSWKHYSACQGIRYFIQAIFLQIALSMILMGSQQSTTGQWPINDCFQLLILQSILYYANLH